MTRITSYDVKEEKNKEKEEYLEAVFVDVFQSVKNEIEDKYYTPSEREDLMQRTYWLIHHVILLANRRGKPMVEIQKSDVLHSLMKFSPSIQDDIFNEICEDVYACLLYRYCYEVQKERIGQKGA